MIKKEIVPKIKNKRSPIPIKTQLNLWILSAGRCEFPGCNKSLLSDSLTLKEDNYSQIAHIIADSEKGPRGHEILSKELAKDFSNLMLLCPNHHKLIDGKNKSDYPPELLKLYKVRHEERIRIQTEIQEDHTTTVLRFMSKIGTQPINISVAQVYKAIFPNYPSDEKGITIDLTNFDLDDDSNYWSSMVKQIDKEVGKHFSVGNDNKKISHLSIFAIGSIPLLMQLGYSLGNIIGVDLYQRHRDTQDWIWKQQSLNNFNYQVTKPTKKKTKDIALLLSLSGKLNDSELSHVLDSNFVKYEITIENPAVDFLKTSGQIEQFRSIYRNVISEIRELYGGDCRIHLFPAIPTSIAIVCGKELLRKVDPEILIYQKNHIDGKFYSVFSIN